MFQQPGSCSRSAGLDCRHLCQLYQTGGTCRRCRRTVDPPVPIKIAVTRDYIIGVEDAKQYRTLKRHLGLMGLPAQYHAKCLGGNGAETVSADRCLQMACHMGVVYHAVGPRTASPEPLHRRGRCKNWVTS
ncbi:MucR family transcriptional regulator [Aminobacter sp. SS-2016]|uniref:MucR family transcriptional regulator n=1 Tax=Aminobacter sp. Y103A TaxID=1870862 RepID=UPI003369E10B